MKIILDNVAFSLQRAGGISVVWYEHLKRLLKTNDEIEVIEASIINNLHASNLDKSKIHTRLFNSTLLFLFRYFDVRLKDIKQPFIFHSSYYRISNNPFAINITTVHDFTYEKFSSGIRKIIHCWQKHRAIRKSDYIICISENTRKDLFRFLPDIDENKIRVIHNGVGNDYYPIDTWHTDIIPFKKNEYLLFVGARVGYKNFKFLVDSLSGTEYKLVIVGANLNKDEYKYVLDKLGPNFHEVGRVSDEQLNVLYNGAYALVYPSSYEGFGIPVIEAQKSGCPVIAYASSSIPEIIGDQTLLLTSLTKETLLTKLEILKNLEVRNNIIQKGLNNSSRFGWDITFKMTYQLYRDAFSSKY